MEKVVEVGEAVVSPEGIRYLGRLYTLRLALQQQWFAKASIEGSWKIPMYYEPEQSRFFIQIDGQFMECTLIQHRELDQERIHMEVGLFRQLKDRWMDQKTGNIESR